MDSSYDRLTQQGSNIKPLYLDNDVYSLLTTEITNSTAELGFDTTVFDDENEVCGTESLNILADYWHKTAETTNNYRLFCSDPLKNSMSNVQKSINATTFNVANSLDATTDDLGMYTAVDFNQLSKILFAEGYERVKESEQKKAEIQRILAKDVSEWTTSEAMNAANWYSEAAEKHDTEMLKVIYNCLFETNLYIQSEPENDQAEKDIYVSHLNRDKSLLILNILSANGKMGTEQYNSLYDMTFGEMTTVVDKGSPMPKCNITVARNRAGTLINWETTSNGKTVQTAQHMMFDKENMSLSEKYRAIENIDGLNGYRAVLKSWKDEEAISDFESVSSNADFNEHCGYNKGQTKEGLFGIRTLDTKYEYINDPSERRYYDAHGYTYESDGLEHLTDEQKKTYNYLYYQDTKSGTHKADDYLTLLASYYLRKQEAGEVYNSIKDSHIKQTGYEFKAGVEGVGTGIGNLFGANDDLDGVAMKTSTQLVDELIVENTTDGWSYVYRASKGIGTALPGIIVTVGTGGVGTAATAATATMYGLSAAGSAQSMSEQSGYSQSESFNYGMAEGIKTGATIMALGGIADKLAGAGKGAVPLSRTARMLEMGKQSAVFGASTYGVEMVDQLFIEPNIGVNVLNDKTRADVDLKEANNQALLSAATAAGGYYAIGRIGQEMQVRKVKAASEREIISKTNTNDNQSLLQDNKNSFSEHMSAEDAARYNAWSEECANGTHNNFPGLNDVDIEAWKYADSKVSNEMAMANVDGDALLKLRSENVTVPKTGVGNTDISIENFTAKDVPTVKNGEFNEFFNSLSIDELDALWSKPEIRDVIEARLRSPGGLHEWHLVSRTPQFKYWDISAEASKAKELSRLLKKNPFMEKDQIHKIFEKKLREYLDYEFEEYCTEDDYYQPVVEDFEIEYRVNERSKKNGFEVIACDGDGGDGGYEPKFRKGWY